MSGKSVGAGFQWLLKVGVVLLVALLALLTVNSMNLLTRTRGYLEGELETRLMDLKDIALPVVQGNLDSIKKDQYELYALTLRESLVKARLVGQDGRVFADSRGPKGMDTAQDPPGIEKAGMEDVRGGLTVVSPVYRSASGLVRSVYFPVRDSSGNMAAVCELTLSAGHIEDLTELGTTHFFLKAIVVVFIIISLVYMLGTVLKSQKEMVKAARGAGMGTSGAKDNVSFVIASFQSVVKDLKDKEKELAELKERAEEKARLIESYNESVLKSVQSGVMTFDAHGLSKTLNPAASDILGIDVAGTAGKSAAEIFGEDSWLGGMVMSTVEDSRPRQRGEGEVRTPAGGAIWLGAGVSPLTGDDGALQGVILVFTDLTEVKELRERMELKERMTVLGEMSAGIAHELRNPMAVISGYARLLSKSTGEDGATREAVESILSEIEGMDDIIREFMNFARPTELNIADVDIGALLDEATHAVSEMSDLVDVHVNVEGGLPEVQGDQVLLRQAILNIMKNAVEAMPGGGTLKVDARTVDAGAEEGITLHSGRFLRVDFEDTGTGIPRDALAKIFTPFFSTKGRGTGLGLALVQKILVYHGGRATVKSVEGGGTTFRVYLPVAAAGR